MYGTVLKKLLQNFVSRCNLQKCCVKNQFGFSPESFVAYLFKCIKIENIQFKFNRYIIRKLYTFCLQKFEQILTDICMYIVYTRHAHAYIVFRRNVLKLMIEFVGA